MDNKNKLMSMAAFCRPLDIITVELFPDLKEDSGKIRQMKAGLQRMWKHGSLADCPGKIVIPIELASKKIRQVQGHTDQRSQRILPILPIEGGTC